MIDLKTLKSMAKNLRVLIAEDSKELRENLIETLDRLFLEVDGAKDGEVALNMFKKKRYDIVLSDIKMPNMDGIELSHKIKSIDSDFPIIILSAYNESKYLFKLVNLGIEAFIIKPPETEQFFYSIFKIVRAIENRREDLHLKQSLIIANQKLKVLNEELTLKNREVTKKNLQLNYIYKNLERRFESEVESLIDSSDFTLNRDIEKSSIKSSSIKSDRDLRVITSASEYLEGIGFFKYNTDILEELQTLSELEEEIVDLIDSTSKIGEKFIIKIKTILTKYSNVFKLLVEFINITNALDILIEALDLIDYEAINRDLNLFLKYFEALIIDFKEWRNSIFIEQNAIDIHYLDDSLLNSVLTIQSLITKGDSEDDEDDVMMF